MFLGIPTPVRPCAVLLLAESLIREYCVMDFISEEHIEMLYPLANITHESTP